MRYLPLTPADRAEMLGIIGVSTIDDLFVAGVLPGMLTSPGYLDVLRLASSKPASQDRGGGATPEERGVVKEAVAALQ